MHRAANSPTLIKLPPAEPHGAHRIPLRVTDKRIGLLPDMHFPYQSNVAINAALTQFDEAETTCIIMAGDQIDFYQMSRFSKDPDRKNIAYETATFVDFLKEFRKYFKNTRLIYLEGNHCRRMLDYIQNTAPALKGVKGTTLPEILDLKTYRIEYIGDYRRIIASGLNIMHGHEFRGLNYSVQPARGLYLKAKVPAITGHVHRKSENSAKDVTGKSIVTYTMGCLCNLSPDYLPYNDHVHGFATVEQERGKFSVRNYYVNEEGQIF